MSEALELARASPMGMRHMLQRAYGSKVLAAEDARSALAVVDEAEIAVVGPSEGCLACLITLAVPSAIACARAGDLERARRYLGTADQMAHTFWAGGAWHAAVAEAKGEVATAEADRNSARQHFQKAAGLFEEAGHRLDADRCRMSLKTA